MNIDFVNCTKEDFSFLEKKFIYFFKKTVKFLKIKRELFLEVNIVDDKVIQKINKEYRNIDSITDVISFAFNDNVEGEIKIKDMKFDFLGEIYIDFERANLQANELQQSFLKEMCFLFVHGLLHLLGYDHIKKEDEEVMFAIQRSIFKGEDL